VIIVVAGALMFLGLLVVSIPDESGGLSVLGHAFKVEVSDTGVPYIAIDPNGLGAGPDHECKRESEGRSGWILADLAVPRQFRR
jgi:hypothetical protein